MIRTEDIKSVTEFRTHMKDSLQQVKENGRPLFLTNGGDAEAVVLSAAAYDELAELADIAESLKGIRAGLKQFEEGETIEAGEMLKRMRRELGLPAAKEPETVPA
ncbi:MAG: type II toxin-antitoxin system Phd/YefM family antitoxin [Planctomycetota bacterium]